MSDNINKMDLKQLRDEVQRLRDELAIWMRKYEDIIYNLDDENFSSRFVKEQGDMRTAIEVNAEGIKTKVSDEEFESAMTQTARSIESVVSKNVSTKFKSSKHPNSITTTSEQKGMLCEYNGVLYYYNDISKAWKEYTFADGIKSQFIQTEDGFEFTNDVKIDADLIVSGTIDADRIDTDNLSCTKLYSQGRPDGYYVKMASEVGDFGLYSPAAHSAANPLNETCIFGVYHSDVTTQAVNFYTYGVNFMGYNGRQNKLFAKGIWDFTSCDDVILPDSAVVAKFA